CLYGKPEGAGTAVSLNNTDYPGLGVPVPYDPASGVCKTVTVRNLSPGESFVFAVAAFDQDGNPMGGGIGSTCPPIEALNPLPLPLCWSYVSRTALGLGHKTLAGQ
ncbi:unnamed protein product, partial [Discosporangium mesarthrocarpum]